MRESQFNPPHRTKARLAMLCGLCGSNSALIALVVLALALRLVVLGWREFYPLGGDEQEYFDQALRLLREKQYSELNLMRPPLYTLFLAASSYLFDSLVQRLRLIQAILSALTVVPIYGITWQLTGRRRVALLAALLTAVCYTLAFHATELLSETLFVFGLALCCWLLLKSAGARENPATGDRRQATGDRRQATGDRRQGTGDRRQATGDRRQATGDRRQATGDRRQATGDRRSLAACRGSWISGLRSLSFPTLPTILWAALAGLTLGLLALLRSVALPLLPLGALWLLFRPPTTDHRPPSTVHRPPSTVHRLSPVFAFLLSAALIIAPWTLRNYLTYGTLIVIDTTGAENLWLDNNPAGATPADPLGREAAKRELYALGNDRAARQQLALTQGRAAITANPAWFAAKAWGQAKLFFALQFFDDMRERRSIWVPPAEVWARLVLGDVLWLLLLFAGLAGLWGVGKRTEERPGDRETSDKRQATSDGGRDLLHAGASGLGSRVSGRLFRWSLVVEPALSLPKGRWSLVNSRWALLVALPWVCYIFFTCLLFHVELRYRLPLYPLLLPYAALALADCRPALSAVEGLQIADVRERLKVQFIRVAGFLATAVCILALLLLHRPYPSEALRLAQKHYQLWQAESALAGGQPASARPAAQAALQLDPASALARVALARVALASQDLAEARIQLDAALRAIPDHPPALVLRGMLRRTQGDAAGAAADMRAESASLDDLQTWAWQVASPLGPAPTTLAVGNGRDTGYVRGFARPLSPGLVEGFRWSTASAQVRLTAPPGATTLELRLAAGRPPGSPPPTVVVLANGRELGRIQPANEWGNFRLALAASPGPLVITIASDTFRPRQADRTSPDGRTLGVMVAHVAVLP